MLLAIIAVSNDHWCLGAIFVGMNATTEIQRIGMWLIIIFCMTTIVEYNSTIVKLTVRVTKPFRRLQR